MVLKKAFPYLGSSNVPNMSRIFDGDEGIRLDIFHFISTIKDACVDNSPAWKLAEDVPWKSSGQPGVFKGVSTVRKLVPPPHVLVPDLVKWCKKWLAYGMDGSGTPLCTIPLGSWRGCFIRQPAGV